MKQLNVQVNDEEYEKVYSLFMHSGHASQRAWLRSLVLRGIEKVGTEIPVVPRPPDKFRRITVKCEWCGREFSKTPKSYKKTCNHHCWRALAAKKQRETIASRREEFAQRARENWGKNGKKIGRPFKDPNNPKYKVPALMGKTPFAI